MDARLMDDGEQLNLRGVMGGSGGAVDGLESSSSIVSINFEASGGHIRGLRCRPRRSYAGIDGKSIRRMTGNQLHGSRTKGGKNSCNTYKS